MFLIGLTGNSGSGKSRVAAEFVRLGLPLLDADAIYHALIAEESPCTRDLVAHFGKDILLENGGIDRKKLADIVFCEDNKRQERIDTLNTLTHHYVLEAVSKRTEAMGANVPAVIFDAPTLIEAGFHRHCRFVIVVTAPRNVRLLRIIERDGLDESAAMRRLDAQQKDDYYIRHADFVIVNDSTDEALACQVQNIWKQIFR